MTQPSNHHYDLIILGAGAAGMMAAIAAAELSSRGTAADHVPLSPPRPLRIAIFERNIQPGIKVLVCGGGRCNLTNAGSIEFLIEQFGRNGRFLTPALRHLSNDGLRAWFTGQGVPTHEEHDGKIYPDSNQARSIVDTMVRRMRELGVEIFAGPTAAAKSVAYQTETQSSVPGPHRFAVRTQDDRHFTARFLLIAVGGQSYPRMGTHGDGYTFAQSLGHSVVTPRPAIVGLICKEDWPRTIPGLAVQDVEVRIEVAGGGPLPRLATGKPTPTINDLLFTHFGLSGPAILNPSEIVAELLEKFPAVTLRVDFLRAQSHDQLSGTLHHWQQHEGRKLVRKMLATLIPERLAETFSALAHIAPDQTCANITSAQMHDLVTRLKSTPFTIHATRGFKEAMVTAGGVALREVDPNTMQSKLVPNLYLAGEVLDLTGPSGGYNLQLAFSTGHLAGTHAARAAIE